MEETEQHKLTKETKKSESNEVSQLLAQFGKDDKQKPQKSGKLQKEPAVESAPDLRYAVTVPRRKVISQ